MTEKSGVFPLQKYFSSEEILRIDKKCVPKHVAIIMDGNRRWARRNGLNAKMGHWRGAERITEIVEAAKELGIETMTLFAFSTENWNRSIDEVKWVMHLLKKYLLSQRKKMLEMGIRLRCIGDLSAFNHEQREVIDQSIEATAHCTGIEMVLALNYGGRDEIVRVTKKCIRDVQAGDLTLEELNEEAFASRLDTAPWGDPELMIRTGGDRRVSNFLLWQISYSEIVVQDKTWPEFKPESLLEAIEEFQSRKRRFGGGK